MYLVVFITKKFVTMHGHMNVKCEYDYVKCLNTAIVTTKCFSTIKPHSCYQLIYLHHSIQSPNGKDLKKHNPAL